MKNPQISQIKRIYPQISQISQIKNMRLGD